MSIFPSNLRLDAKPFLLFRWDFQAKDRRLVDKILIEWFTASTLENILTQWENITPKERRIGQVPLNILCYNVQGWSSRNLEVIEMVSKVETSICIFTGICKLWNTSNIVHFNIFH